MTTTMKTTAAAEYDQKTYPCPGEAHSPEAAGHVDHCSICQDERDWGKVRAHKALTPAGRWLLVAIGDSKHGWLATSGLPIEAAEELVQEFGLATFLDVENRTMRSTTTFGAIELTAIGVQAYRAATARVGQIIRRPR